LPRRQSDYFTDDLIHKTAQDFAVSYNNHAFGIDRSDRSPLPPQHQTPASSADFDRILKEMSERPIAIVRPVRTKEDGRFADLDKYVDIVSRVTEASEPVRVEAEKKLYGLIMVLSREGRISGGFGIQPYRNAEIERLDKRIDVMTKRLDAFIDNGKKALK
jgi:hypothetical protein